MSKKKYNIDCQIIKGEIKYFIGETLIIFPFLFGGFSLTYTHLGVLYDTKEEAEVELKKYNYGF